MKTELMKQQDEREQLILLQVRQLRRLIEACPSMKLEDAWYIIFSDYPCADFMGYVLQCIQVENTKTKGSYSSIAKIIYAEFLNK